MVRSGFQLAGTPFLRLLLPLCIGVGIAGGVMPVQTFPVIGFSLAILVILFCLKSQAFNFQPFWGGLLFVAILFFGFVRTLNEQSYFPILPAQQYFVVLDEYPQEKEKTFRVTGQFINSKSRILAYLPKSQAAKAAIPGDMLCFAGLPELVKNEGNPYEFDYKRYLNSKKIGYRVFLKEHQYCFLKKPGQMNLFRLAQQFREKLIHILSGSGMAVENVPLVASIAFGARDDVDKETIQKFTNTGVIHVLAVSGMNVGLVFVILDFIFRSLRSLPFGNLVYTGIILAGIWFYALITGMSASILRAAIMFSFVIIGRALNRHATIFNTMAASAFLLIAWEPSILYDIGFQLSYAAVSAIVVVQPILYKKCYFRSWFLDKMWLLLSVTFAAQLGTLPFTLQYFHQFPLYFWLANLAVIPLVTLILYLSFVVIFFSFLSFYVTSFFAFLLDWSVRLVIISVNLVDDLPHSVLKGLNPGLFQLILLFVALVLFYQYSWRRKFLFLQGALLTLFFLSFIRVMVHYGQLTRSEIVFFNIPGARVMALSSGKEAAVLFDQGTKQAEKLNYYLTPYFEARGIKRNELFRITDSLRFRNRNVSIMGNLVFFNGVRLYLPSFKSKEFKKGGADPPADLIWLTDQMGGKAGFLLPPSRILLYRGSAEVQEYVESHFSQHSINVKEAVKLTIKTELDGANTNLSVGYFNSAYSSKIPLPCRTISASPVVQSTMVEGLLSP